MDMDELYNFHNLWDPPHNIPNPLLTRINDFATRVTLDLHVLRPVTKFHSSEEGLNLTDQALASVKETIRNFRDELLPRSHEWPVGRISHYVDELWQNRKPNAFISIGVSQTMVDNATIYMKQQIARYMYAINNRYYNIVPDNTYNTINGVKVVANKRYYPGEPIRCLKMCVSKNLSNAQYRHLFESTLLDMYGLRDPHENEWRIACGPLMYVNHACEPNCRAEQREDFVELRALRGIQAREELTWRYGYDFFGKDNKDCKCGDPKHESEKAVKGPDRRRKTTESSDDATRAKIRRVK